MNHAEITQNLVALLERWQRDEINEKDVFMDAEYLVELTDDPWPTQDDPPERYLPYKALNYLEDIMKELITKDDIPFFQNVLSAETNDEIRNAIESFPAYFSKEQWQERREQLRKREMTGGSIGWYHVFDNDGLPYWYKDE